MNKKCILVCRLNQSYATGTSVVATPRCRFSSEKSIENADNCCLIIHFGELSHRLLTLVEQSIPIHLRHSFCPLASTLGVIAVILLQSDGEHGLEALPGTWVQVVWVGAVDQIVAEVLALVAVLVSLLIWMLAVVVHH